MGIREYCCCAIPIFNVGIYFTIFEQFVLGVLVGTLAIATPPLVGASTPSFSQWIVAVLAYLFAAVQLLGFLGVFKEKPTLFSRYTTISSSLLLSGLATTAAFVIVSATRHEQASNVCETTFFTGTSVGTGITTGSTTTSNDDKAERICEIFTWVGVGLMGGLWLVLAIFQGYLVLVCRSYGQSQREDHKKYYSIYSVNAKLTRDDDILLTERNGNRADPEDVWDSRPSTDSWHPNQGKMATHQYQSDLNAINEEKSALGGYGAGSSYAQGGGYGGVYSDYKSQQGQPSTDQEAYLQHPSQAYTQDPGPTPAYYATSGGGAPSVEAPTYYTHSPEEPASAMAHPAEGSFGRKTPRKNTYEGGVGYGDTALFQGRK